MFSPAFIDLGPIINTQKTKGKIKKIKVESKTHPWNQSFFYIFAKKSTPV